MSRLECMTHDGAPVEVVGDRVVGEHAECFVRVRRIADKVRVGDELFHANPVAFLAEIPPHLKRITAVLAVDIDGVAETVTVSRAAIGAGVVQMLRDLRDGGGWDIFKASHAACERLGINEAERRRQAARDAAVYEARLVADGRLSTAAVDALADGVAKLKSEDDAVALAREVRYLRDLVDDLDLEDR